MHDALGRIGGETQDVAGIGDDVPLLPGQQHGAIFGDLVLPLLGVLEIGRVDVFEPDEDARHPGPRAFLDETGNAVAERIDLDDEVEGEPFGFPHADEAIENGFPILVAGEIVVGDEIAVNTLAEIEPDDLFDIVG